MKPTLGKLEKVELRQIRQHETSHFTPWLSREDNLSLLGEVIGMFYNDHAMQKASGM